MKYWLVGIFSIFWGDISADKVPYDAGYVIEGNAAVDKARARLNTLEEELQWLVSYYKDCGQKSDDTDPNDALKLTSQKLPADVERLQAAFAEFSKEVWRSIGTVKGPNAYAFTVQTASFLELTNWYASFIEENLFPRGWQALYQDYLKDKENARRETSKVVQKTE
ncbi:MAG: hypothetical protein JSR58_02145 [Verrucomicrobia bacterium]|nr:hypothetical protein [Verrucomicrobiota bacterium]